MSKYFIDYPSNINRIVSTHCEQYEKLVSKRDAAIKHAMSELYGGTRADGIKSAQDAFDAELAQLQAKSKYEVERASDNAQNAINEAVAKPVPSDVFNYIQALKLRGSISKAELVAANAKYGKYYAVYSILYSMGLTGSAAEATTIKQALESSLSDEYPPTFEQVEHSLGDLTQAALGVVSFRGDSAGIAYAIRGAVVNEEASLLSPKYKMFLDTFGE